MEYSEIKMLADDLAELYIQTDMSGNMIMGSKQRAKEIRAQSDANIDPGSKAVQNFRNTSYVLLAVVGELSKGVSGYKLVKI